MSGGSTQLDGLGAEIKSWTARGEDVTAVKEWCVNSRAGRRSQVGGLGHSASPTLARLMPP